MSLFLLLPVADHCSMVSAAGLIVELAQLRGREALNIGEIFRMI